VAAQRARTAWASAESAVQFARPGDERLHTVLEKLVSSLAYMYK